MRIKFANYLLVAVLQALLAVCRGIKMTKYINRQRKRAEKVRFTEFKKEATHECDIRNQAAL